MADLKARFIPGSQIQEAATGNLYLYVEAMEGLKAGDEVAVNLQLGRAKKQPEVEGVYMPFGKAVEYIPKGQFGLVLVKGSTSTFNEAMRQRAMAAAKEQGIDLSSRIKSQTATGRVK